LHPTRQGRELDGEDSVGPATGHDLSAKRPEEREPAMPGGLLLAIYVAGAACLFLLLVVVAGRLAGGYAPGWQIRCPACGRTADAGRAGIVRAGAASIGKLTLGYCSQCRRLRWLAVERTTTSPTPGSGKGH
jgi:hypothetical protein